MVKLIVNGEQNFMGKDIPVVAGGFGKNQKCISDKMVAEIHSMGMFKVRERITANIRRFREGTDYIDLKRILMADTSEEGVHEAHTLELLQSLGYAKQSITQAEHIYLLSERGYAKLIKIMDTDLAWEIHDKLMDEYFLLREKGVPQGKELLALAVLEARKIIEEKDKLIERMRPKEIFADAVASSDRSILIGELAKLLKQNGIDTGEKRLFVWMRINGYLIKRKGTDYNMPTQKSMELGLFEIKETIVVHADGHTTINKTTKVTGKGQQYFINKFLPQDRETSKKVMEE